MENSSRASELLSSMEGEYFVYTEGGVAFLEPVSKEPIEPNLPPRSLVEDNPYTSEGFRFLAELAQAQRLYAWLILSGHGSSAEFDDVIADEISREALLNSTVAGVEVDWRAIPGKLIPEPLIPEVVEDK